MGEKGTNEFGTTKLFKGKRGVRQRIAKRNGISDAFSCDITFSETPEIVVSFTLKAIKVGTEVQDFLRGNVCAALVSLSKTPCGEKQTKQHKKVACQRFQKPTTVSASTCKHDLSSKAYSGWQLQR